LSPIINHIRRAIEEGGKGKEAEKEEKEYLEFPSNNNHPSGK
jgi:hypothetical protein